MGQTPIFVGPMTVVKIQSTSSTILTANQTYSSRVKSQIQAYLLGRCDAVAGADDEASIANNAAELQDYQYHLYDECTLDDAVDDGEESED